MVKSFDDASEGEIDFSWLLQTSINKPDQMAVRSEGEFFVPKIRAGGS